jgi:glucose/mannose-6-phosphate isomerase
MGNEELRRQIESFPSQFFKGYELGQYISFNNNFNRIIFAGMGGSALSGEIIKSYFLENKIKIPVEVLRDYTLPSYVNDKTLIFLQSYSGNTEEMLYLFREIQNTKASVVVITTGGILQTIAERNRYKTIVLPSGLQPRLAIGLMLFSALRVLENSNIVTNISNEINECNNLFLKRDFSSESLLLLEKCEDEESFKIPLIYSSNRLFSVSMIWKTLINENSKRHAFFNTISELNHNEMVGFTKMNGDYFVILFEDEKDNVRIKQRITLTKDIIKKSGTKAIIISVKGTHYLSKILGLINLGQFFSYHLASKNDIDPCEVKMIEKFKKNLGKVNI